MHICVSTPFNLGVAYSCFGPDHQYFLVSVYKSNVRNKGRDYSAQNKILLEVANRLHLEYRVISVQDASSLVLSDTGIFAVDYRVGEILPEQRLYREIYENLILIVNGADFWQVLSPLTELLRGRKVSEQVFDFGLCPVAEELQSRIMAFKTNYLDVDFARKQAEILARLIDEIGRT